MARHMREIFGILQGTVCKLATFVYHRIAAWSVIQFGRHKITREVTERGVVCRKEIGHTVQKTFWQNVPQDAKIESIETYWVQGKGTRSVPPPPQERRKRVWLKYQKHTRFLYSQFLLSRAAVRTVNLTPFLQTTSHSVLSYSCRFLAAELIGQTYIRMQFSRKDYYQLLDTQWNFESFTADDPQVLGFYVLSCSF
jgi:hypothetical protein